MPLSDMNSDSLSFPTVPEFNDIYEKTPFPRLDEQINFQLRRNVEAPSPDSLRKRLMLFKRNIELNEFVMQLQHRLVDAAKSYVMISYYFQKGIPDKNWHISPGRQGASIEYFPDFKPIHYQIKDWFDYYADFFFYKAFSCLDNIGHILNLKFNLKIDPNSVSFEKAIKKMPNEEKMKNRLNEVIHLGAYKKAKQIRNDITHNIMPSTTGLSITMTIDSGSFGIRKYVTSQEIIDNTNAMVQVIEKVLTQLFN